MGRSRVVGDVADMEKNRVGAGVAGLGNSLVGADAMRSAV
jgi:hypothetical protein